MDRSLRQLDELLVVHGRTAWGITGVALALIMDNAESSRAAAALGCERTAVLAGISYPSVAIPTRCVVNGTVRGRLTQSCRRRNVSACF